MAKDHERQTVARPGVESGGYRVQPEAGPPVGMNSVLSSRVKANGRIQNDQLFMRGRAMSGAPIISRYHPVGQTHESGHDGTEDHHQCVHGGHLVEKFRIHQLQTRREQFGANHQLPIAPPTRNMISEEDQVQGPDFLVIGSEYPARQPGWMRSVVMTSVVLRQ